MKNSVAYLNVGCGCLAGVIVILGIVWFVARVYNQLGIQLPW